MILKFYIKYLTSFDHGIPLPIQQLTFPSTDAPQATCGKCCIKLFASSGNYTDLFRLLPTHTLVISQGPDLRLLISRGGMLQHNLSGSIRKINLILIASCFNQPSKQRYQDFFFTDTNKRAVLCIKAQYEPNSDFPCIYSLLLYIDKYNERSQTPSP